MVESLEEQNGNLHQTIQDLRLELDKSHETKNETLKELSTLRNRLNISQENWAKEREELLESERFMRGEHELSKQAMQDWEIIATEERSVRESLADRLIELKEQISTQKAAYDKCVVDRDTAANTVNGLQRALQDIQDGTEGSPLPPQV